jgi:ABC-2 type transport system permease protein
VRTFGDIGLLFGRSFREAMRNGLWVIVGVSTPLLYLALFTPLLQQLVGGPGFPTGSSALDVFLPGLLAFLAFGSGLGPGYTTMFELQEGTVERFRVTPVSRFALLIGPILSNITWLFIFSAILVAIAVPFGFHLHIAGMVVSFVLLALTLAIMASFSISIAFLTKDISSMSAILNGLNLPILLLSGVLLPLTLAPQWMRIIAHINPLYYVVDADRVLAQGNIMNGTVGLAFLVMLLLTALTLWWATRVYRKAVA